MHEPEIEFDEPTSQKRTKTFNNVLDMEAWLDYTRPLVDSINGLTVEYTEFHFPEYQQLGIL